MRSTLSNSFKSLAVILFVSVAVFACKKKVDDREKFLGTYNVNETCTGGNITYTVTITESSVNDVTIIISNFGNFTSTINATATVSGNSITIANQTSNGVTVNGTGAINGSILTITYSYTAGSSTDNCTATCTKQ